MTKQEYKEQLEQWWGEAADAFPGPFHVWLSKRIEDEECEDETLEMEIFIDELGNIE